MILNSNNIALLESDILNRVPTEQLKICQELILSTLELLDPTIKKAGKQFPDDPTKRELQIFKDLRDSLAGQVKGKGTQKAVERFVDKGVTGEPGNYKFKASEEKKLTDTLSKLYGPEVAKDVTSNIKGIVETQWTATKQAMADSVKQYNRAVSQGLNRVDQAVVNVLNNQNNFFISGMPDKLLVGQINQIVADHVTSGLARPALEKSIQDALVKEMPVRSDVYYRILANDVLGRARQFAQVNAYVEARIRRFEIFAVLDERTTEICEHMDGMVFEVEVARKIVRDVIEAGVPGTDAETDAFKALRPWVYFDQEKAGKGDNALYIKDAKGNPMYLPNSTFGKDGKPLAEKGVKGGRDVEDLATADVNAPVLPPYHSLCRSTTVVDEDDVKTQEWTEELDISGLGPGQNFVDTRSGDISTIANVGVNQEGKSIITTRTKGTSKSSTPAEMLTKPNIEAVPTKIAVIPENTLDGKIKFNTAQESKDIVSHPIDKAKLELMPHLKGAITRGDISRKEVTQKFKEIKEIIRTRVPSSLMPEIKKITLDWEHLSMNGDYNHVSGQLRIDNLKWFLQQPQRKLVGTTIHEVGHGVHPMRALLSSKMPKDMQARLNGVVPSDTWDSWLKYDKSVRANVKGKWFSDYAKTNEMEHFAEVFKGYITDANLLKALEPKAFEWFELNIKPIMGTADLPPRLSRTLVPTKTALGPKIKAYSKPEVEFKKEFEKATKNLPTKVSAGINKIYLEDTFKRDRFGVIDGEYYSGSKTINVFLRESKTRLVPKKKAVTTLHHEIGHHVYNNNSKVKIPKSLRKEWVDMSDWQLALGRKLITQYAEESPSEHFAEAFAYWFTNPKMLKKRDPVAFDFFRKKVAPLFK